MHGNKRIFGYINEAFYADAMRPQRRWFLTREERDAALERFREHVIEHGLSKSASMAGIRAIKRRYALLSEDERQDLELAGYAEVAQ